MKEAEVNGMSFCLRALVFFLRSLFGVCLERGLSENLIFSTWQESIGWHKTLVLCNSLIERFLNIKRANRLNEQYFALLSCLYPLSSFFFHTISREKAYT